MKKKTSYWWTTTDRYLCCHPCPNSLKRLSIINYLLISRKIAFSRMANTVFEWITAPNSRRSSSIAASSVNWILKDIDNKKLPLAIYMDLSKMFDTLDHNILIKKLQYYGVIGTPLNWFQSYLTDRTQYVEVNNGSSSLQTILTGVP